MTGETGRYFYYFKSEGLNVVLDRSTYLSSDFRWGGLNSYNLIDVPISNLKHGLYRIALYGCFFVDTKHGTLRVMLSTKQLAFVSSNSTIRNYHYIDTFVELEKATNVHFCLNLLGNASDTTITVPGFTTFGMNVILLKTLD